MSSNSSFLIGLFSKNRNILQRWRRSLHVPLRLDVLHHAHNDGVTDSQNQDQQQPQGELLERWCIDYVASSNPSETPIDNNETIAQLRQVCKRVVILLRSLHCLSRMLPSYRVHKQIQSSSQSTSQQNTNRNYFGSSKEGSIGFTIYAAPQYIDSGGASIEVPPEFSGRKFTPVPTPFGLLCFSVIYHPKPIQRGPTRAIAIAGAGIDNDEKLNRNSEKQVLRNGSTERRILSYESKTNEHQKTNIVSDFVIPNYAVDNEQRVSIENEKNTREKIMSDNGTALSGLSLALMSQCQLSSQDLAGMNNSNNHAPPNLVSKSYEKPSGFEQRYQRLESEKVTSGIQACKSYEKPSFIRNQSRYMLSDGQNEQMPRSVENKPNRRSILSSNAVYTTNTPPPDSSKNCMQQMTENTNAMRAGEYGYGYNGYNNVRMVHPRTVIPPINGTKRVSPPYVATLGSTPPLSQNINLGHISPIAVNASPPFPNNPVALMPPLSSSHDDKGNTPPSSNLQNIITSRPSLEVLTASPFQPGTDSRTLRSSMSIPFPSDNLPSLPFGNSVGSTASSPISSSLKGSGSGSHLMRSLYKNGIISGTMEQQPGDNTQQPFDDMPFATEDSPDASSCSIHTVGETSAASSFARRCSTANRLQLFNSTNATNNQLISSVQTKSEQNMNENSIHADLAGQLAEFRNFGASLLQSSNHPSEANNNGSRELQKPTPVA